MSLTYTISTNFAAKDTLPSGDPDKVIRGADFTTEFQSIQAVFQTAAPSASPTFTGTVTAPTFTGDLTGNVTGDVTGNAGGTSASWATPRTITFTGGATGSVIIDGTADESVTLTVDPAAHAHTTYDHSAHLSGASVFDQINVTDGIVTSVATRNITLADLGYTGDSGANNYVHPAHPGDDINLDTGPLSGAVVISDLDFNVTTDTQGHVTDANATYSTRSLTPQNIGALADTTDTFTGTLTVSGAITCTGDITAFSDERLKSELLQAKGLEAVEEMNGYTYVMNDEVSAGVIAQELEEVAPELVRDGEYKSVNYMGLTAYLIEAVKELSEKVKELETR